MARKESALSQPHGLNDVIGILLGTAALLLMVALLSYDPHDLAANNVPPNNPPHNLGGPARGMDGVDVCSGCLGSAAFMIPALLLILAWDICSGSCPICSGAGLGRASCCFAAWAWPACSKMTSHWLQRLRTSAERAECRADTSANSSTNTFCGTWARSARPIVLAAVYARQPHISDQFPTGRVVPPMVGRRVSAASRPAHRQRAGSGTPRARFGEAGPQVAGAIGKSTKAAVPKCSNRAAWAPTCRPVPEPTVRDLSVPQGNPASRQKAAPDRPRNPRPPRKGRSFRRKEVAAATMADILGGAGGASRRIAEAKEPSQHPLNRRASRSHCRGKEAPGGRSSAQTQTRAAQTQTHRRRRHPQNRQLHSAHPGFPRNFPIPPPSPPNRRRN